MKNKKIWKIVGIILLIPGFFFFVRTAIMIGNVILFGTKGNLELADAKYMLEFPGISVLGIFVIAEGISVLGILAIAGVYLYKNKED